MRLPVGFGNIGFSMRPRRGPLFVRFQHPRQAFDASSERSDFPLAKQIDLLVQGFDL